MCHVCEEKASFNLSRRKFITTMAASVGLLATGLPAFAATPPKPENVISPDEALKRLMMGNERYVSNKPLPADFSATRAALAGGQNPYASLLSCADSRISPELCFDAERGDLFVTRVAGNFVTPEILATVFSFH